MADFTSRSSFPVGTRRPLLRCLSPRASLLRSCQHSQSLAHASASLRSWTAAGLSLGDSSFEDVFFFFSRIGFPIFLRDQRQNRKLHGSGLPRFLLQGSRQRKKRFFWRKMKNMKKIKLPAMGNNFLLFSRRFTDPRIPYANRARRIFVRELLALP